MCNIDAREGMQKPATLRFAVAFLAIQYYRQGGVVFHAAPQAMTG